MKGWNAFINLKLLNLGQGSPLPCILGIGAPVRFGIRARLQQIEIARGNLASMLQGHLTLNNQTTQEKACVGLAVSPIVSEHSSLKLESLVAGKVFVILLSNSQASKLSFSKLENSYRRIQPGAIGTPVPDGFKWG